VIGMCVREHDQVDLVERPADDDDTRGVTRGQQALVESVKNNICGQTRDLIPGTLQV
jgi:hypothetical protein